MKERCCRWSPNKSAKIGHTSGDADVLQGLSIGTIVLSTETIQDFILHHKMLEKDARC